MSTHNEEGIFEELPDRIVWDFSLDPERLQREVNALLPKLLQKDYIYYSVIPLRGPIIKPRKDNVTTDIDYADPSLYEWVDSYEMQFCPYIKSITELFETDVTNIRLMRLESGASIKEHTDPTLDAAHRSVVRIIIPISPTDDTLFILNNTAVPMRSGEPWYMRLSNPHAAFNNGCKERINLSVDLIYNDWLERKLRSLAFK